MRGWRAWRWLFLIEGVITVFLALCAYFILPNFPRTTSWLDEEEKALAAWRLQEDVGEDDWISSEEQSMWHGFKLALEDVKTWVLVSPTIKMAEALNGLGLINIRLARAGIRYRGDRVHHQFLPNSRQDSWIRRRRDSPPYNAALYSLLHRDLCQRVAR